MSLNQGASPKRVYNGPGPYHLMGQGPIWNPRFQDFRHFRTFALLVPRSASTLSACNRRRFVIPPSSRMYGYMRRIVLPCQRAFSTTAEAAAAAASPSPEKIVASVLFERLPVVVPKIDPVVYAFQEFSFRWQQQYRRRYPDEFLNKSNARGKGDYQIEYTPAPRITEADKTNDKKSLNRALDRRLYLLLYGNAYGAPSDKPVWHFPEKVYDSEETLRKCAESALHSVLGGLSNTYFVGNAPMGHMTVEKREDAPDLPSFKRFFFKSQVIAKDEFNVGKCKDFVWVTKDELLEYFPDQAEFLNKMIIS